MIANYIIYFNNLTRVEQSKQLSIILVFLLVLLIVVSLLAFFKIRFYDETKGFKYINGSKNDWIKCWSGN